MNESYPIAARWFWWLLGLTTLLLFLRLGAAPIYILDEAKNAQCAREMLERRDWIVPTFNGVLRTDKPALHYWFMMFAYRLFGVNAFAARFFSVTMGIATIAILYQFTARWINRGTAFLSALVLASSAQFLFEMRLSVPDPYLIFFTTAGLLTGFSYLQTKKWKWLLLLSVSLALATLAKGPVALGLPGICFILYLLLARKWQQLFDPKILVAAFIYALITVPWYYAVHRATGGAFTQGFFFEHNLNRFSSQMEGHGGPFIITPLIIFIGMFPFSAFLFSAIKRSSGVWRDGLAKFGLIVVLVYTVFFSISSTKLPNYPMPCYPFVALLIGVWLNRLLLQRKQFPLYGWVVLLMVSLSIPVGGFFALRAEDATGNLAWYACWLLILSVSLTVLLARRKKEIARQSLLSFALAYFVFNLLFICFLYPLVYQQNPVSKMQASASFAKARLVAYQDFNPAFLFNQKAVGSTIAVFEKPDNLKQYLLGLAPGDTVYVVTKQDRLSSIDTSFYRILARHHDLFERPTTVVLKKK